MPEARNHEISTPFEDIFTLFFGAASTKTSICTASPIHWSVKTLRTALAPWAHHQRLINPTGDNR